jgi:hypothetical protein
VARLPLGACSLLTAQLDRLSLGFRTVGAFPPLLALRGGECPVPSPLRLPMQQLHRIRKSTESTTQLRPYPKASTTHRLPSRPTSKRLAGLLQLPQGRPYLRCPSPIYAGCQLAGHGSPFAPPIVATRDNTRLLCPAQSQQSQRCWNFGRLADLKKRLGSEQGLLGTSGRSHLAPRTLPASVRPTITNEGKRSTAHKRNKRRRQPKLPNAAPLSLCRPC